MEILQIYIYLFKNSFQIIMERSFIFKNYWFFSSIVIYLFLVSSQPLLSFQEKVLRIFGKSS